MNFDNNGHRFAQRIGKDEQTNRDKTLPRIDKDSKSESIKSKNPIKANVQKPHKKRALKIEDSLFVKSTSLEVIFQLQRTCLTCEVTADAQVIAECQIDIFIR